LGFTDGNSQHSVASVCMNRRAEEDFEPQLQQSSFSLILCLGISTVGASISHWCCTQAISEAHPTITPFLSCCYSSLSHRIAIGVLWWYPTMKIWFWSKKLVLSGLVTVKKPLHLPFPKGPRVVNTGVQKELVNELVAINVCADLASKCRMAQVRAFTLPWFAAASL
jgi:hypothetical protein